MTVITTVFAPTASILFLLVFLYANNSLDKFIKKLFFILLLVEFAELIFSNLEIWTSTFSTYNSARVIFSAITYTVRIIAVYLFFLISNRKHLSVKSMMLWAIPVAVNTLISFSALFTDIAYSYSATNSFLRGPLGYMPHIIFFFYLICILFINAKNFREINRLEAFILFSIVVFISASVIVETFFYFASLQCTATVLSTVFYYMFFQTQVYSETVIHERKNRKIYEEKAKTDELTGLLNKSTFIETAEAAISGADSIALVFLDLDHFKSVNDTLGHLIGDIVLKETAETLRSIFRNADIIGRFGGDEFFVFLHNVPRPILQERVEEIISAMHFQYSNGTHSLEITASIGAVYCESNNIPISTLLEYADKASYEAKNQGRNTYVIKDCII